MARYTPITYKEEGFDDYLRREFDWARILEPKKSLMGAATEVRIPGGDIDYPEFEIPPSTPYENQQVKEQGVMTIGGAVSNGTDLALPNLSVEADELIVFEIYAYIKAITSGTVVFTVNIGGYSIGSISIAVADEKVATSVQTTIRRNQITSVDVSGTHAGVENASIGIGVKQEVDPLV